MTHTQEDERNAAIVRALEDKDIVRAALKEWLDQQFATFGRWTFYGLLSAAFCGAVFLALKGWHW